MLYSIITGLLTNVMIPTTRFASATEVTYANSTTETSLLSSTFKGSRGLSARRMFLNSELRFILNGVVSTKVAGDTLTFKIKATDADGTVTTLTTLATSALPVNATTQFINLDISYRVKNLTQAYSYGGVAYKNTNHIFDNAYNNGNLITFINDKDQILDVTATWGSADVANILKIISAEIVLVA